MNQTQKILHGYQVFEMLKLRLTEFAVHSDSIYESHNECVILDSNTSVNADWSLTRYIMLNIDFGMDFCSVTNMTRIFKIITSNVSK